MSPEATGKQDEQVRDVLVEAAQAQLAAVTAAVKFWSGWAQSAEKYAQAVSDEVARISEVKEGGKQAGDIVGRMADLTREYLRNLTELPNVAVKHFNSELEKVGRPKTKRTRAARVKD